MSLYINKSNQDLLWNTLHKSSRFAVLPQKAEWFRSTVERFHRTHGKITDVSTLLQVNRETIQTILDDLYPQQQQQQQQQPHFNSSPIREEPSFRTKEEEQAKKQELYALAFEEKQRQYQLHLLKPAVPEVNFLEKLDDEPLTNIDELVEKQRQEREQDYSMHYPLAPGTNNIIYTLDDEKT